MGAEGKAIHQRLGEGTALATVVALSGSEPAPAETREALACPATLA